MKEVTEQELMDRTNMPRVTLEDVKAAIKEEHYLNLGDSLGLVNSPLNLITQCILVLQNDFVVTGVSACVHADNYLKDVGERIAHGNAVNQIWELLGFELRTKIHKEGFTYVSRLRNELTEVSNRLIKLRSFLGSGGYRGLSLETQMIMRDQEEAMAEYVRILSMRIEAGEKA